MGRDFGLVFLFFVTTAAGTHAQSPELMAQQQADMMNFQAAMMKAQAGAVRPGDEAASCPALDKEMVAVMNDPAMKAYAAKTNPVPLGKSPGAMTPAAAAALAKTLTPDAALTGMPGMTGMPTQAQIAMSQKLMVDQMKHVTPVLPALMRSQRLMMLAAVKQCKWN